MANSADWAVGDALILIDRVSAAIEKLVSALEIRDEQEAALEADAEMSTLVAHVNVFGDQFSMQTENLVFGAQNALNAANDEHGTAEMARAAATLLKLAKETLG